MRKDVSFSADGVTLRGWLYLPEGRGSFPTVVMAHGFSAVKEQFLDRYAEVFAQGGLAALVFDNRNFGASDGEPRQEIDPLQQVRDYRHAITYVGTLKELDKSRIGVWGTSFSGGHALAVAALDRRVRCVVSQVPHISGYLNALRRTPPELWPVVQARLDLDREARFMGKPPGMIALVSEDPQKPCVFPGKKAWELFQQMGKMAASWRNEVTLRSLEMAREYEPGLYAARISPTPLLMIVAASDYATPTDLALEAYERALEPKKLLLLEGEHFDAYLSGFDQTSAAARDWFVQHLRS